MEQTEVKLEKKYIYSNQSGKKYIEMLVPEGWNISIHEDRDNYGGYPYPYTFRINLRSPDKTVLISYFSPRRYIDDHMLNFRDLQIDDYGNYLNTFKDLDTYLDNWARNDLEEYPGFRYLGPIEYSNMAQLEADRKAEALQKRQANGQDLNWYYYKRMCRAYYYKNKETDRIRVYAGIIEAEDFSHWAPVPAPAGVIMDPFMRNTMLSAFPGMHYDQDKGSYVRLIENETGWTARKLLLMDCIQRDYDHVYKNIFDPIRREGVTICDDIWNEYEELKKQKSAQLKRIREDKAEAARIRREAEERSRQSRQETYDYIRKTQQEIHDIQKSSYENTQKTQAKVREMWGDVNQGNTRFVDRHGDEHVIHTYNNYAYKSGDTYVTSDSPLDHSYDWEELEKKKY